MSSILEALRKSDDKRKQTREGGVDNIQFSESQNPSPSRKGFYFLVLLLLLVAAGVWAYQAGYFSQIQNMLTTETPNETTDFQADSAKQQNDKITAEPKKEINPIPQTTLKPPQPKGIKNQIVANKKNQDATKKEKQKDGGITAIDKPQKKSNNQKKDRLIVDGKNASNVKRDAIKQTTKRTKKEKDKKTKTYLLAHQLPFAIRQQMPSFKVNVHVFDPNPDNRLVIINGVSFKIGDSVEEVATIKDITSEGVVVDLSGTVFLIPK